MKRLAIAAFVCVVMPQVVFGAGKPMILLFPVSPGRGATNENVIETTKAFKTYIRNTGKADVADFDPESSVVLRAIEEHKIQPDDIKGQISNDNKLRIAKVIGMNFVVSGEIRFIDGKTEADAWIADTKTDNIVRLANATKIDESSNGNLAVSNSIQSAVSSLMIRITDTALKGVKPDTKPAIPEETPPSKVVEPELVQPAEDAGTYLSTAEEAQLSGDIANAILAYRRVINADPSCIEYRLKLTDLYVQRRLYTQAVDELERAQRIEPNNESIKLKLAQVYEQKGSPEKAAGIYISQADKNPKDISARITAGDTFIKQKNYDEAEKQYRMASEADSASPLPHAKLAASFASQRKYDLAAKEVADTRRLDPKADAQTISSRYDDLIGYVADDLKAIITQYDASASSFASKKSTREDYYAQIRGLGPRVDAISNLLQAMAAPDQSNTAHKRLVLGCNLLSQSVSRITNYLETNKAGSKEDAAILLTQAKKNIGEGLPK